MQTMLDSFLEDSLELKIKRNNNLLRIKELNELIETYKSDQESELDIFSPKNNKDKLNLHPEKSYYNDVIEEYIKEKDNLEFDNNNNDKEIHKLDQRITELQEVISVGNFLDSLMFLDIQEKERKRIARDLHDTSLQNLTHLIHVIELSSLFIDKDPAKAKMELEIAGKKIRVIIDDIRNTIYDLRPMEFDDLSFKEALLNLVLKLQKETDIVIDLKMEKDIIINNDLIYVNIYRIIRECITNSIKHSEASKILITIDEEYNSCNIRIKDNGKGFDNITAKGKRNHFGLQILEERVQLLKGSLIIHSNTKKEEGTNISIVIPIRKTTRLD